MVAPLNFNDYPDIVEGDIFWRPPPENLKRVNYLYDRSASCLNFLFQISDYKKRNGYPPEMHAAAYIRAALVEYVGIEEAMQSAGYDFKIISLTNPLLHFMRLLRNYQIHVGSHPISSKPIEIVIAGKEAQMNVAIIDNLDAAKFMKLTSIAKYKNYDLSDMNTMIEFFNIQQARLAGR